MALSERENYLRTASMTGGEWTPMRVKITPAEWDMWREEMEEVALRHPTLFPNLEKGQMDFDNIEYGLGKERGEFTDKWGCVWHNEIAGMRGVVHTHPLADWSSFDSYQPPDPMKVTDYGPVDWAVRRERVRQAKAERLLTTGSVRHGFLFMRMYYLRGFENFMMDMATDEPRLHHLVDMLTEHNRQIVSEWLKMGVDVITFGEDLGMQTASFMGPKLFGKWIAPSYKRLMQPCREAGTHVYLHSDGYIMDIVDQILDCGVTIINPQDLLHGIDNLAAELKGRVCISLDVDRQRIVPFGTRQQIHDLIEEEVRKLGSPQGGLMLICAIYPPTPPENVDAVCCAFEKFRTYWWE